MSHIILTSTYLFGHRSTNKPSEEAPDALGLNVSRWFISLGHLRGGGGEQFLSSLNRLWSETTACYSSILGIL